MEQVIADSKYWLDNYTKAYKENDKKIGEIQGEFNGRFETVLYQLERRITVDDMKKNFDKLNDMLFIKFKQVEDNKAAVRDMLNYQKYFYPMQMQAIVGENMMNLQAAMKDQKYVQYTQAQYEEQLEALKKHKGDSRDSPDVEMVKHLDTLNKADLKTTGWTTTPLDNVDHDFVTKLLDRYLKDLEKRIDKQENETSTIAEQLRKSVQIFDSEDLVNVQYDRISSLKEEAARKEHELELERIRKEHEAKVKRLANERVDFRKQKGFKRSNSYKP